ncbi:transporter [Bordetella genomosp. 10]|uniref:Transporter n=1 Tax=Bordetella genomosp. 10 TaxID=1416804 RepID=A0A261S0D8_9BORD|nr:AEC family transporter [Bordetella genomosp. 10]OZI30816.1 transporter [Bordetella genomosp. 10]
MFILIITALLPVYVGLALGYFAGKRKLVDNQNVSSLNVLLMQFALPLTLFISIARTPHDVIVQNGKLALVIALGLLIVYIPLFITQRRAYKLDIGSSAVQTLTSAFPNFASIGLPLLMPFWGAEAALPVAICIAVGSVTISPLTLAFLDMHTAAESGDASASAAHRFLVALWHSVRKPIFVGPMLGLIVALAGVHVPAIVGTALTPMTAATAGVGLFLTGLMLSAQPIRIDSNVMLGTLLKNLVQPLIVWALAVLIGLAPTVKAEAILLTAIPAGFFGLVFGASSNVRPAVSGSTLVVSSVFGIVTLSLVIYFFAPMK